MEILEIRFHGRGGQGAVTASNILAAAAIREGKWAQSFPTFGAERRGAPVRAFTRISDEPIYVRCAIYNPDIVAILDPSLLKVENVVEGLKEGGIVVANTEKSPEELRAALGRSDVKVVTVPALKIALEELKRPIVNTAILGALIKGTGVVKLESVIEELAEFVPHRVLDANVRAVKRAYDEARVG